MQELAVCVCVNFYGAQTHFHQVTQRAHAAVLLTVWHVRKTHGLCSCCGSLLSPGVDKATRQQRNEPRDMRVDAIHSLHRVRWARPTPGNTILGAVMLYLKSCQAAKWTRIVLAAGRNRSRSEWTARPSDRR
jgi:hypothetical protein